MHKNILLPSDQNDFVAVGTCGASELPGLQPGNTVAPEKLTLFTKIYLVLYRSRSTETQAHHPWHSHVHGYSKSKNNDAINSKLALIVHHKIPSPVQKCPYPGQITDQRYLLPLRLVCGDAGIPLYHTSRPTTIGKVRDTCMGHPRPHAIIRTIFYLVLGGCGLALTSQLS